MNDLKESHETIKQTTDELKKQQDDLKNIVEILNKERNDWVNQLLSLTHLFLGYFSGKKI
jgi:FtsZ-binding cell division protein ZapB